MADRIRRWIVSMQTHLYYGEMYTSILHKRYDAIDGVIVLPSFTRKDSSNLMNEASYHLRFFGIHGCLYLLKRQAALLLSRRGDFAFHARALGKPVYHIKGIDMVESILRQHNANLVIATVPVKVPASCLDAAQHGWLNTHCGPLPRYRGMNAPFWCMYHEEPKLAVSIHIMDQSFDTGDIVLQRIIPNNGEPYFAMLDRLFQIAVEMHIDIIDKGTEALQGAVSQSKEGTYFSKPPAELGRRFRLSGGRFC